MRGYFSRMQVDSNIEQIKRDSFPTGTNPPYSYILGNKGALLSSTTTIEGSGDLVGYAVMGKALESNLTGSGEITSNLSLIVSLASAITALGIISGASVSGSIQLAASITSTGSVTASLSLITSMISALNGSGVIAANLKGTASLEADIFVNQSEATTQELAAAVWNALTSQFNAPGTMGEAMAAAGSAGDPWITNLPGGYAAGSAGHILGNILTTIPDSVWDELKAGHTTSDSYGKIVQDLEQQVKKLKGLLIALT
jgi:hypothetical protein